MPQTGDLQPIKHYLDALRQEIICNTVVTPRHSGFQPDRAIGPEEWAKTTIACWRNLREAGPGFHLLEKYKFFPQDSPYAAETAEVFCSKLVDDMVCSVL